MASVKMIRFSYSNEDIKDEEGETDNSGRQNLRKAVQIEKKEI
jgi:hypothetical protein